MKVYVIAPHAQTAKYYAQAFGLPSDPRRTITLGSSHALPMIRGLGAGEFYVVNADNGAISEDVIREVRVLELCHPESVTVEWVGFGEAEPNRAPHSAPSPRRSLALRLLRRIRRPRPEPLAHTEDT